MRTLREFLLTEASAKVPEGFKVIDMRGKLSDQAKIILGGKTRVAKTQAETNEGRTNIKNYFNISPSKNPISIIYAMLDATTNYNEYFFKPSRSGNKFKKEDGKYIIVPLKGEWKNIAGSGKASSSSKIIKFWISSTIVAYGGGDWDACEYAIDSSNNLLWIGVK